MDVIIIEVPYHVYKRVSNISKCISIDNACKRFPVRACSNKHLKVYE